LKNRTCSVPIQAGCQAVSTFIIPPRNRPIGAERGRLHPASIIALPGGNVTCRKAMIRETRGRSSVSPDH